LITAQENERSFIARELHDDICQQVAALSIAISNVKARQITDAVALREELAGLQQRTMRVLESIRHVSHGLHPGTLRYVGLGGALKEHCTEFSDQHGIAVTLFAETGLENLPSNIALCLYRVAQEALRNVAAHAEASRATVVLRQLTNGVEMTITDDGRGFRATDGQVSAGLGLISLDERVRLVSGTVRIRSSEKRGTELFVHVPLPN
jgi:two-component system sensor histidine kinase UhpB